MLDKVIKGLAILASFLLLLSGARWLFDAPTAAAGLGMDMLEGVGRSTQIGDLAAFFVVAGVFGLLGVLRRQAVLLYTPAALVGCAALFRSLATLQGAPFALQMIGVEIIMLVIFLAAARRAAVQAG